MALRMRSREAATTSAFILAVVGVAGAESQQADAPAPPTAATTFEASTAEELSRIPEPELRKELLRMMTEDQTARSGAG